MLDDPAFHSGRDVMARAQEILSIHEYGHDGRCLACNTPQCPLREDAVRVFYSRYADLPARRTTGSRPELALILGVPITAPMFTPRLPTWAGGQRQVCGGCGGRGSKTEEVQRRDTCGSCGGRGSRRSGKVDVTCGGCGGRGAVHRTSRVQVACRSCGGRGYR
ncbi:MAG TPA: hypothetical protein VE326_11295 [Candidatus Binatia bacterium]|nr:hypothetical protein [Candidatus Binatia bacterium]